MGISVSSCCSSIVAVYCLSWRLFANQHIASYHYRYNGNSNDNTININNIHN
jgi:hypothetical protein